MGQSSSASSKSVLPSTNLLIDASDSYVTDVKLRSAAIIPISEYIKKDKCNKNQHSEDTRKKFLEAKVLKQQPKQSSKLITIDEETVEKKEDHGDQKLPSVPSDNKKDLKKEKQQFIESSYEDLPDKRKWISVDTQTKSVKNLQSETPKAKEDISSTKVSKPEVSSDDVTQLYKNDIYPHIYKNKHKRKMEQKEKLKEEKKKQQEKKRSIPVDSNIYFPDSSNISSKHEKKHEKKVRKYEESTHQLNQHHYDKEKRKRKRKRVNLSIQTNVACIIHPDRSRQVKISSSDEIVKKKIRSGRKRNTSDTEITSSSYTVVASKIDKFENSYKEPKKTSSAKQALESWKNMHTMKQIQKVAFSNDDNNSKYKKHHRNSEKISSASMRHRSRAGYRDKTRSRSTTPDKDRKLSPLEQSNINYLKQLPQNVKTEYITPHEIKERADKMKNFRKQINSHPRHELVDYSSYGGRGGKHYGEDYRYKPNSARSDRSQKTPDREDFIADMERCLQKRHQITKSIRRSQSPNHSRTTWVQDKYRRWHKVMME